MSHRILITGGSGYLGGTLLAHWKDAQLPPYLKLYALVRTRDQTNAVEQYGAEPLTMNLDSPEVIKHQIVDNGITIVFFLISAWGDNAIDFIEALAQVKKETSQDVHFLFTTGAKMFSSHAGAPTDKPLSDMNPELYDIQKGQKPLHAILDKACQANNAVIETAEALGVRSYIFAPCIVYGKGEGFGNPISIQTVAIVNAARKLRQVYKVDAGRPTWPVCHVHDNAMLYLEILRGILSGKEIGHGKNGYFLASSGSVAWYDLYAAMAKALKKKGIVDNEDIKYADDAALQSMGDALDCPKNFVAVQLGGLCTFTAVHGKEIGWKPRYQPEHILESAEHAVELILQNLKES